LGNLSCHKVVHSDLPQNQLKVDGKEITVEIANQVITRETGLMFRRDMPTDHGMLFVFPDTAPRYFWMKNTYIPLSIAFLDEKGVVLNVLEMPPLTESSFPSQGPAKYAIEMNKDWFESNGVKAGDKVEGLGAVPTPVN
jgi:uncharacterized membrane protein (UPF0127 family)